MKSTMSFATILRLNSSIKQLDNEMFSMKCIGIHSILILFPHLHLFDSFSLFLFLPLKNNNVFIKTYPISLNQLPISKTVSMPLFLQEMSNNISSLTSSNKSKSVFRNSLDASSSQQGKLLRMKLLQFHEDFRPPYYGE